MPRQQHGTLERRLGMVEYLLCNDCEQKFSALEDYTKRFFYGNTNPIRLQLPIVDDPFYTADYKRLRLFQLSVLWRASVARGQLFSAVKLGDIHDERIRLMLVNSDPGKEEEYFCSMSRFLISTAHRVLLEQHGCSIETGSFAPVFHNHGFWQTYTFVMGGLAWIFCVSSNGVPEIMRNTYIKENGRFYLKSADGDKFLFEYAMKAVKAGNVTKEDAEESMRAKHR